MKEKKQNIKAEPSNFIFLGAILVLSIPFYLLNLVYHEGILIDLPLSFLMIFVPFFCALYFSYQKAGRLGVKKVLIETHIFKSHSFFWLGMALLLPFILFTSAVLMKEYPDFSLGGLYQGISSRYLILFLLLYLGAWLEEIGWTTYLTKQMQNHYGILSTGLIIGAVWGLWHLFPYLSQGRSWEEIFWLISLSILYRVIMGYLFYYSKYNSLTATLFHTQINFLPELMTKGYVAFEFSDLALVFLIMVIIIMLLAKSIEMNPIQFN